MSAKICHAALDASIRQTLVSSWSPPDERKRAVPTGPHNKCARARLCIWICKKKKTECVHFMCCKYASVKCSAFIVFLSFHHNVSFTTGFSLTMHISPGVEMLRVFWQNIIFSSFPSDRNLNLCSLKTVKRYRLHWFEKIVLSPRGLAQHWRTRHSVCHTAENQFLHPGVFGLFFFVCVCANNSVLLAVHSQLHLSLLLVNTSLSLNESVFKCLGITSIKACSN